MYSTDDEEQKIEIYKKYQLTYLVPVYADETRQHSSSDELFVKARLFRKEERWLEAAKIYEQLANSDLSARIPLRHSTGQAAATAKRLSPTQICSTNQLTPSKGLLEITATECTRLKPIIT